MLSKEQVKQIKWYRQSGAGLPLTMGMPFVALAYRFFKKTGLYFPNDMGCLLKTQTGHTFYHYFDYYLTLKQIEKTFETIEKDEHFFTNFAKDMYSSGDKMEIAGLELLNHSVKEEDFSEKFLNFLELSYQFWENSLFIDMFDPFEEKVIAFIFGDTLEKLGRTQINILMAPDSLSNLQREQKELLEIAKEASKSGVTAAIEEKIAEHSQKYYWLKNDYETVEYLDKVYYLKKLNELINKPKIAEEISLGLEKFQKTLDEKKQIIQELNLDQNIVRKLNFFNWVTSYRDDRKKYNQISNFILIKVIEKISKELEIDLEKLRYAMPEEITKIIQKDPQVLEELEKRNGIGVLIFADKPGPLGVLSGQIAREYFDILESTIQASEIKGTIASSGKAIGEVRIILNQNDFPKMRKGDILLASMTRPEYAPIMRKAAAIVTDEGGLTCHAAIVSRELGIPCIVGTQIATKTLKDGDLIDVNANHGLVKIIKKA